MSYLRWRWVLNQTLKGRRAPFTSKNLDPGALKVAFDAGESPVAFALAMIDHDRQLRATRRARSADTGLGECARCGSLSLRHEQRHERHGAGIGGGFLFLVCLALSCVLPILACVLVIPASVILFFDLRTVPVQYRVCNACGFWTRFV